MEREELRTLLTLAHPWTPETLRDHFAAVQGGVAYPGRRPGHAIVAGLCTPKTRDDLEIHVLAETESPDLGELLRACRGLAKQYRLAGALRSDLFRWIGDGEQVGANRIIWRLNEEDERACDQLTVETTTLIDAPSPYLSMFSVLSELTRPDRKRLFLHGSLAAHAMNEVPPDEVASTKLGEFPAIEALAVVVDALRSWLDCRPSNTDGDTNPYRGWRPGRYGYVRR
jgi:hypothetical protein